MLFKAESLAMVGVSLALGAIIGEYRKWEDRLNRLGEALQARFGNGEDNQFVKGFVSASLLFV